MKTKLHSRGSRTGSSTQLTTRRKREKFLNLKSIIVPVDFSGCCRKAVQYAVAMAKDYGAGIILVHISSTKSGRGKSLTELDQDLHAFARREIGPETPVTILVKQGDPLREIINLAETGMIDLMIISTHGRAGLPDFCMGSAAEQIVRYAPCPVLVVREHEHDFVQARRPSHDP